LETLEELTIYIQELIICCLMSGIYSEKSIVRRFHHHANIIKSTYYKPRWYSLLHI
uniref:Uncharacterized protein n=1 Tax=Marmota marmota marmota TaxID=9994 RepID=A0A8C5Z981_MARMA